MVILWGNMEDFNIIEILGKNIHNIRFKKNMSLKNLAQKAGISLSILRRFEAGEQSGLTLRHYVQIADALGVSLEEITKGIEFTED